ncbi:hypothetical protein DesLBE_1234 [Desulfitobacterium sp. LBE]|uniref:hypothetical protein n=1 Tax=Desulfitobacterium sp. LBE TaxID=884086 RepID=UPI001199C47A|nr:hypothetical protein [Desulfitobacterium sp. LBE]TWH56977.1 hypothetical protein DesLBE_1234 [Desulfitobacterium sp. LBE]
MKGVSIAIIAMVLLLGGCGQHVIIDWVDFVQLNDIHDLHDDSNELFELKVYSGKPIYKSTDKIRIWATLKYVGSDREITLWHGDPGILFYISDGNELEIGGIKLPIQTATTLKRDKLYTYDCQLYVGGDEPIADYWRELSPAKGLFLPKGEYEVKAVGDFSLNEGDINPISISDKITVKVVE